MLMLLFQLAICRADNIFVFSKFMDSFILENQIETLSDTNTTLIGGVHKFPYLLA